MQKSAMKTIAAAFLFASILPLPGAEKPNILLILTDDLGYSDLGCYGSEIETPVLDRLAENGLRFNNFYSTAKCHSSRVSLLTGRYSHQAGNERLDRAVTLPELLQPAGYFTTMTGKWHLKKEPTDFGFQRYWGHLSGATHFFKGDDTFRLNGEKWEVPEKDFYTTVANADWALKFIEEARERQQPWLCYMAFNAPHAPLHALKEDYKKYEGRYAKGWDAVYAARVARQKEMQLFGGDFKAPERPVHLPAWENLSRDIRDWEEKRMTTYAAMIDRVDQEIGRVVADLEANGELDNTLILFFSDNGACPYDRHNIRPDLMPWDPRTRWTDSTGWAWARNAPFRFYKQNQFEGGASTPAIIHWPAGLATEPGTVDDTPAHLIDVLPTLAEIAGAEIPKSWPGRELTPVSGISLKPILDGKAVASRPPIHLLFDKDRGLRDGDWKLVSFRSKAWELYNLAEDRCETENLADKHPDRVTQMAAVWHRMAEKVVLAPEAKRKPVADKDPPHLHPQWSKFLVDPEMKADE
ncbi:sulfatase [Coraliomargarita sinensis]|uniref:Sulfatase n=1 Tax=Coraliomargarita sinensis TaxID=2174842 RepID=A0A317ZHF5_9BACT|nr:arylsulfatase [Coraliomargarita sinensis]PXA04890.1 sulfatase [Coraliomargarita sinensis]